MNDPTLEQMEQLAVEIDPGEWALPSQERPVREPTFADIGIFNRQQARAAGVRTPKRVRSMAVPRTRNAR